MMMMDGSSIDGNIREFHNVACSNNGGPFYSRTMRQCYSYTYQSINSPIPPTYNSDLNHHHTLTPLRFTDHYIYRITKLTALGRNVDKLAIITL
jgi:hypothetical protein